MAGGGIWLRTTEDVGAGLNIYNNHFGTILINGSDLFIRNE